MKTILPKRKCMRLIMKAIVTVAVATCNTLYAGDFIVHYKNQPSNNNLNSNNFINNNLKVAKRKQLNKNDFMVSIDSGTAFSNGSNGLSAVKKGSDVEKYYIAKELMDSDSNIEFVLPTNVYMKPLNVNVTDYIPVDHAQYWSLQWSLPHQSEVVGSNNSQEMWNYYSDLGTPMADQVIGIIDSGLAQSLYPDVTGSLVDGVLPVKESKSSYRIILDGDNFVATRDISDVNREGVYHGTHVAGIANANGPFFLGVAGPTEHIKTLPINVFQFTSNGEFRYNTGSVIDAIRWAVGASSDTLFSRESDGSLLQPNQHIPKVINLSLANERPQLLSDKDWQTVKDVLCPAYEYAANTAEEKNTILVYAAGNESVKLADSIPAACTGLSVVIAQANAKNGALASYSNYLPAGEPQGERSIVTSAGGEGEDSDGILSESAVYNETTGETLPSLIYLSGTSMAAPGVSGLIAVMSTIDPNISYEDIKQIFSEVNDGEYNKPLDFKKALEAVR